ncbi:MAG: hypothetical protein AB8I08_15860 [Sandaracinaceae bacterium]
MRLMLLSLLLLGCVPPRASRPAVVTESALETWRGSARGTSVARVHTPVPIVRATPPRARDLRLASGRRVDVDLHRAPLADALWLLAEAGGRSLVSEPDLGAHVSVRLRHVDPLRAMHALAEAHGVEVTAVSGVLIARLRQPLSAAASPE